MSALSEAGPTPQPEGARETALVRPIRGDKDQGLEWLQKAYEDRSFQVALLKVEPRFDSLRLDPRFSDLLRRIGLTP